MGEFHPRTAESPDAITYRPTENKFALEMVSKVRECVRRPDSAQTRWGAYKTPETP